MDFWESLERRRAKKAEISSEKMLSWSAIEMNRLFL